MLKKNLYFYFRKKCINLNPLPAATIVPTKFSAIFVIAKYNEVPNNK